MAFVFTILFELTLAAQNFLLKLPSIALKKLKPDCLKEL